MVPMRPFLRSSRTRPASAALLALVVAVVALLPGSAKAGTTFTFYGSGYGHGLGMAQYGSLGLALKGWGHGRILRHYYEGTSVGPAPSVPNRLRVVLVQSRASIRLTARNGGVELRLGDPDTGTLAGRIPRDGTWTIEPNSSGRYRILNAQGSLVGGHAWGSPDQHLFARYANSGARVFVEQAGHTYSRGSIEFNVYRTCSDCAYVLRAVIRLSHTAYLLGIGEVPSSWPMRALRAQAVASLTYALEKWGRLGLRAECNCHLYASVLDQVYIGWDKEGGELGSRWVQAVLDIGRDVVLLDGQPIQAFFHSSSGGYTADNRDVFGAPLSYLQARCDIGDNTPTNPNSVWTVALSDSAVTTGLSPYTGNIGTVTGFSDTIRDISGRMTTVTVNGTGGSATLTGSTLRSALRTGLALKSTRVWVNQNRHVTGPIRTKYDGLRCAPGLPTSEKVIAGEGHRQSFDVGRIYHKVGTGAHWLHGSVLAYYLEQGGPAGDLGFPLTDVQPQGGGATKATFEGGTVTCTAGGACSESA
jgi:stage II sporulation protein D